MACLNLISKLSEKARVREEASKMRAERKHNSKMRLRSFHAGDLVWKIRSEARQGEGKFSTNWTGHFRIHQVASNGAYYFEHLFGKAIPGTWNASSILVN